MEFQGKIGDDWRDSEPWWPPVPSPPDGAPNVVLIVLDDVGFAQLGCYGSDIDTPRIDALAADGVRLGNFHTTALCSPTRACLITGRNHHRSGMGRVADLATGFPGYWGRPPRENGFLSEILRANGYATYAVGKWHLSPEDETNMAASRSTWPLARGFDRWYGFHGGETHQFVPALYHDNHAVRPPRTVEDGYHLSADLADRAIEYLADLRAVDDQQPFFLYFCTGACHSPHHAPAEWIEHYRGRFAQGWDAWRDETFSPPARARHRPRRHGAVAPAGLGPGLGQPRRREQGAGPTVHGMLRRVPLLHRRADRTIARFRRRPRGRRPHHGRPRLRQRRQLRRREGRDHQRRPPVQLRGFPRGRDAPPHRRDRRPAQPQQLSLGLDHGRKHALQAVEARGARGGCRRSRASSDCPPTGAPVRRVLCAGSSRTPSTSLRPSWSWSAWTRPQMIDGIAQSHLDGTSFAYLFAPGGETEPGRHVTQHFEMLGSRAIYHDGWKAVAYHPVGPIYDDGLRSNAPFDEDVWELYHVAEDVSEAHDLAAEHPEKVAELVALWWDEARRNDVLPLDNRVLEAMAHKNDRRRPRDTFRYFQGAAPVPEWVAADVRNRSHTVTVTVDVADGTVPNGTLLALGCALGGWSLHVLDGRLRYVHNLHGQRLYEVVADSPLEAGRHVVEFRFDKDRGAGGQARSGWTAERRHGECRAFHAGRLQRGRHRADLWLRVGTLGGGGLRGAVPLQRHHRARRGDRHRSRRPGPRGRRGRHPGVAVTRPATVVTDSDRRAGSFDSWANGVRPAPGPRWSGGATLG